MNPSYPGSSGDRHGPPSLSSTSSSGLGGKGGPPSGPQQQQQHSYHPQPSMAQLTHGGHLHPLHGGPQQPQQQQHSIMHPGGPVLPPPPLPGSLGGGNPNTTRSPHPLSGSILHPPRGNLGGSSGGGGPPSVLGKPAGSQGPPPSSAGGMMGHPVRMQAPSLSQSMGSVQQSMAPSSGGLKPPTQGYSVRPQSPPRRQPEPQQQQQQQVPIQQQYGLDGRIIPNDQVEGDYYQQQQTMSVPPPRHRELRVEDALLYLDQVKQQFGDQPDIYNQFLDVMKDFKAQAIDTPGVIMRVSTLFRGYPTLILGFNTFLPPGYRIRPDTSIEVLPAQMAGRGGVQQSMYSGVGAQQSSGANMGHRPPPVTIPPPPYSPPDLHKPTPSSRQQLAPTGQMKTSGKPKKQQALAQSGGNAASRSSTNPVEFDHAIHYVTTIKQRFADEPETYKEFLAILHTYQKEQRSIRQVLDQVSHLFRDHPDLLREFTFFLPDAVQEQAKERLNRAAEKAQQRKDQMAQKARKYGSQGGYQPDRRDDRGGDSPSSAAMKGGRMMGDDEDAYMKYGKKGRGDDQRLSGKALERREKERERERNRAQFNHKRAKRRPYDGKERRAYLAISDVLLDKEEWNIFEKIKKILPSRDNWREFLKCLELYSQEVLDRNEMLSLIRNLFGRHTDLVEEFDHLLCSHGVQKTPKEIWPFIPLAETDLSQCRRATPSYRGLPASYPIPPCSHRSALEKQVCNDSWVSVPTGSEDYSFKSMRKNQYEEALFKCEDERFEIDMVIEANASTISILEPLAHEIEVLNSKKSNGEDDKLWNYVVEKGTFRVTHLNAITRIYGDSGAQILDLLRKYPAGAIPVILKRLKQKDEEWRRAREDLNRQWKEVNEKNYHKSLDHSSFYFKQKDKKQTSMKMMMQEAKKKLEADEKRAEESKTDSSASPSTISATAALVSAKAPPQASDIADALKKEQSADSAKTPAAADIKLAAASVQPPSSNKWKPHFAYKFASVQIHKEAFGLLSYAAEKNLSVADKEKVSKVWQTFFFPFFHLEEEWLVRKPQRTTVTLDKAKTLQMGTEASTDFGEGTVEQYNKEKGYFSINLAAVGCQAFLQPGAITIQEAAAFPPGLLALDSKQDAAKAQADYKSLFYGNQHAYAFLRLYQMLHNRLERAFDLCEKAKRNRTRRTINPAARALAHAHHSLSASTKEKTGDYQAFLSKLYSLIDGSVDNSKYEDSCRSLMGSTSYFLFTMDKLVTQVLKQMQHLANDDTCQELIKAFGEQQGEPKPSADPAGAESKVAAYLTKTKSIFEGEGAFRIEFNPGVLRKTPLEARGGTTPSGSSEPFKIWAPSPRVKAPEPSKWLFEPELAIEYLGSMDEDGEDDDDDDEDSPSPTPVITPSATPVYGSPVHETPVHDSQDDDDDELMEESKEDDDVKKESATPISSGSVEQSDSGSSDDVRAGYSSKALESATLLKKRARGSSEDDSAVSETSPLSPSAAADGSVAAKKAKTTTDSVNAAGNQASTVEVNMSAVTSQRDDPMAGESSVSSAKPSIQVTQAVKVDESQGTAQEREKGKDAATVAGDKPNQKQTPSLEKVKTEQSSASVAAISSTAPAGDSKARVPPPAIAKHEV